MTPEEKLDAMGLTLPPAPRPIASYVPTRRHNGVLYLAGQGPMLNGEALRTGKFGAELSLDDARELAEVSALNALAAVKLEIGELSKVRAILALTGYVASTVDFFSQHLAMNGASELLVEVLGEAGKHARVAIGTNVLPMNMPMELSMVVAVAD